MRTINKILLAFTSLITAWTALSLTGSHARAQPMTRIVAKLFAVAAVLTICLPVQPSSAQNVAFVTAVGLALTPCTQDQPCGSIDAGLAAIPSGGQIVCLTPMLQNGFLSISSGTYIIDCPFTLWASGIVMSGGELKFQHVDFNGTAGLGNGDVVKITGGGTLILDDCVFEDFNSAAMDIEPTSAFHLVMKNGRVSNNAGGILLKPGAGGSIKATFDHVTIANNTPGGGLKIDTTNGPVTVDVNDNVISDNAADGINVVGNAGSQALVSIKNSVIAQNGQQGVVANGANAAALLQMTLLDQNVAGATLVGSGGHISTYGNNSIVGSAGSGFTATAPLQ